MTLHAAAAAAAAPMWGEGTVSGSLHRATLGTGVKKFNRHHNATAVSMPTQPHRGEAYTSLQIAENVG